MRSLSILSIVVLVSTVACVSSCKKKQAQSPQTFSQTQSDQQYQQQATQQQTDQTQVAAQPQGPVTSPDPVVQALMAVPVSQVAQTKAKGMTKEGELMAAQLQQGQSMEQLVLVQPGKCYTVVALGLPMIDDLGIILSPVIPIPGAPNLPMAQSVDSGAQVAMAPTPNCYKHVWPMPIQAKVIVTARSGSGQVGAQIYVK